MKQEKQIFDKQVPPKLKKTQQWFASIITMPIDTANHMSPTSPTGHLMEEEAFDFIVPSRTLKPDQRIQIYNQQYWWRLFGVLQDSFPFLTRLFGYHDFNQLIAKPYLMKYHPNTWTLTTLGDRLPLWIQEDYSADDKQLVLDAASIDAALNAAFFVKHMMPCQETHSQQQLEKMLTKTLHLQPHIHLFDLRYDLFAFRSEMLKQEVDYWLEHDFPKLPQDRRHYFILFRNLHNQIHWEELSEAAYHLLTLFKHGATVDQACNWLEGQDEKLYAEAVEKLHLWFQEWTFRQWLYVDEQS